MSNAAVSFFLILRMNRTYYLGFTIVEDGQEKLGWLKVRYSGADSITIIESAVQNF